MDYKEKVIALLNSQELSDEQIRKLEASFPELAESEDERVKNYIISCLNNQLFTEGSQADIERKKAIAWLEKQGKLIEEYEDKLDRCACYNFNKGYKAGLKSHIYSEHVLGDELCQTYNNGSSTNEQNPIERREKELEVLVKRIKE